MNGRDVALAALLLSCASPVLAQRVDGNGVPFRPWDLHMAGGFDSISRADGSDDRGDNFGEGWRPAWTASVDVGRYWTSHLKTEAGLVFVSGHRAAGQDTFIVDNQQTAYVFRRTHVEQTQVVLAGAYQFFENAFAHPYVSAGARVGVLRLDSTRDAVAYVYSNGPVRQYPVPPSDERSTDVRVRPFIAVGSKSYLSERTFIRPEMALTFNRDGLSQFQLRLGFGVDF